MNLATELVKIFWCMHKGVFALVHAFCTFQKLLGSSPMENMKHSSTVLSKNEQFPTPSTRPPHIVHRGIKIPNSTKSTSTRPRIVHSLLVPFSLLCVFRGYSDCLARKVLSCLWIFLDFSFHSNSSSLRGWSFHLSRSMVRFLTSHSQPHF